MVSADGRHHSRQSQQPDLLGIRLLTGSAGWSSCSPRCSSIRSVTTSTNCSGYWSRAVAVILGLLAMVVTSDFLALIRELDHQKVEAHLNFQKALFCMPNDTIAAAGIARTAAAT